MQIPFIVEFVDGNKEKVVTGTPDFIARRAKRTDKSFEDFVETLDTISGDDADPKV